MDPTLACYDSRSAPVSCSRAGRVAAAAVVAKGRLMGRVIDGIARNVYQRSLYLFTEDSAHFPVGVSHDSRWPLETCWRCGLFFSSQCIQRLKGRLGVSQLTVQSTGESANQ
ncbi:hypothetical protein NDU88_007438 [Pleurodeles waltl]|uniref:Uncharacterized protein n=1 Tax=Pleurodeles waltl TaxID=8319 RepID=A0AAV7NA70_PLEWA|nr:hypothetical protein NDU88_007438 [Pleurodeles waltl]